jgi:predicted O-linked N-acetylglucosamine transferase (SPINDLY family)
MKAFDNFYDVESISDQEIAKYARDLEIDVAIDLSGHTKDSKTGIFSYRAAPIQINYLGYPGTLGADYFDYIIADEIIIPESSHEYYSEKIAYLPHTYMVDDRNRIPSTRIFSKTECEIPENTFVYCCFNNGNKLNVEVLNSWSNILLAVPNSVLWVSENNKTFQSNLLKEFKRFGIDSHRIIFAKRVQDMNDHLARYKLADVFLDTFPYNAHTTAMDSLKAGVPVITLISQSFAGRVAASLLTAIGLPSLITETQSQYESLAIELAQNADKLAAIKAQLASNYLTMPLFNTPLFTRHIEKAFSMMMDRYWSNLSPDNLRVLAQNPETTRQYDIP